MIPRWVIGFVFVFLLAGCVFAVLIISIATESSSPLVHEEEFTIIRKEDERLDYLVCSWGKCEARQVRRYKIVADGNRLYFTTNEAIFRDVRVGSKYRFTVRGEEILYMIP